MASTVQISATVESRKVQQIRDYAKADKRTFSQMIDILLGEALLERAIKSTKKKKV